ncbi:MAG: glutathione S-transferase family protein, partial [Gammaproteobacteria bacterium]
MGEELIFYTNPMSRGRIVRWMLEEVGAPYATELLEYGTTMKSPEYLAINPMGKVPAIRHKGVVITECAAICAYLADAFPDRDLAPALPDRGAYYRWLFFFSGPVESAVINKALGIEIPEGKEVMSGYGGSLSALEDVFENLIEHSLYVAGDVFTAADVYCGSQIGWGLQFGTLEKRPAFEAYWERLSR